MDLEKLLTPSDAPKGNRNAVEAWCAIRRDE